MSIFYEAKKVLQADLMKIETEALEVQTYYQDAYNKRLADGVDEKSLRVKYYLIVSRNMMSVSMYWKKLDRHRRDMDFKLYIQHIPLGRQNFIHSMGKFLPAPGWQKEMICEAEAKFGPLRKKSRKVEKLWKELNLYEKFSSEGGETG